MLHSHRAEIEAWLEADPAMTAVDVLTTLEALDPDRFTDHHLRTTQRMVKTWRADQAKRMIRCATAELTIVVDGGTVAPPPWVHRDLPRPAALDPRRSRRAARVPPVSYGDGSPGGALGYIVG
jgi:hypothetical protein